MNKKFVLGVFGILICFPFSKVNAQLTVLENGNVGVHLDENVEPKSFLSVGGAGMGNAKMYVYSSGQGGSNQYGVYSSVNWGNHGTKCSIYGYCTGAGGSLIGVKGEASIASSSIPMIGVYGIATGSTIGKNYGVLGTLKSGEEYGAGLYGTTDGTTEQLSERFAGYFRGRTHVNGHLTYTTSNQTSDIRLKTNITGIKAGSLQKVKYLHPIQFQWKQVEDVIVQDTTVVKTPHFSSDIDLKQKHYGLIAQEVQKVFPELVQEGGDGYLSVNYIELIPLLIQAVQELSAKVENQNKQIKELQSKK